MPLVPRPIDRRAVAATLRTAGCVFAEDEASLLIAAARDRADLDRMIARRAGGEPLEHVVGWAELCGVRVVVDPGVFVPRRRSELLVERAAALAGGEATVVDLCCGSGAVGAAIAAARAEAIVHAADLDPNAVRCARRNLPADRVFQGDLYDALPSTLRGHIDVLVVNAPYVPTDEMRFLPGEARLHEPAVALDGGPDGLDVQRRVAAGAAAWLSPTGHLLIQTSEVQAPTTAQILGEHGFVTTTDHSEDLDANVVTGSVHL